MVMATAGAYFHGNAPLQRKHKHRRRITPRSCCCYRMPPLNSLNLETNAERLSIAVSGASKIAGRIVMATLLSLGVSFSSGVGEAAVEQLQECKQSAAPISEEIEAKKEALTNETLVEEVWDTIGRNFLDVRHQNWSPEKWLFAKQKVLSKPLRNRQAAYSAVKEMLATLDDPFTRFLTPEEFKRTAKYDISGIGLNFDGIEDENGVRHVRVIGVVYNSPAQLAGIHMGDEVVAVDGNDVVGKTPFEVSTAIQGRKGTQVTVKFRNGECATKEYVFTRQQDLKSPVLYRVERSDVPGELRGYIRIQEFNALTRRDLVAAVERLKASGVSSFVLDLTNNVGGLFWEGIEVAKLFLEDGQIVTYLNRKNFEATTVSHGEPLTRAPLIVLINERTASASELAAGALHDNCKSVLVGSKTYGKGLVQAVYGFPDGSGMVTTVAKYLTPRHTDIDQHGISPDFRKMPGTKKVIETLKMCKLGTNQRESPSVMLTQLLENIPQALASLLVN